MADASGVDIIQANRNDFIEQIGRNTTDIKSKFRALHLLLYQKENAIIKEMQRIQKETLKKFDKEIVPKLTEIKQAQESIRNIVSSNSNKEFMEKQVGNFNTEFDNILSQSGIQKLIELKWKIGTLNIDGICQIITTDYNSKPRRRLISLIKESYDSLIDSSDVNLESSDDSCNDSYVSATKQTELSKTKKFKFCL